MSHAYAAYKDCGCLVAAIVDEPRYRDDVARSTSRWLRGGMRVERVDTSVVRARLDHCTHGQQSLLTPKETA